MREHFPDAVLVFNYMYYVFSIETGDRLGSLKTQSPSQSAPTILKNWAPCFFEKNRVQKTKVIVIQKEKRQPGLFSF